MFTQKRKNFFKTKTFFALILVALAAFGVWMNWESNPKDTSAGAPAKTTDEEKQTDTKDNNSDQIKENEDNSVGDENSQGIDQEESAYYLVKEVEGVVKVFYYDDKGNESLYSITSIPYDLISQSDQALFKKGVVIKTEEELASFLENFDS